MLSDKLRRLTLALLILPTVMTTSSLSVSAQANLMARVNQGPPQSAPERPQTPNGLFSPNKAKVLTADQTSPAKVLDQAEADLYLRPKTFSEPVPSVTERTTELLERQVKKTNHRDAGD